MRDPAAKERRLAKALDEADPDIRSSIASLVDVLERVADAVGLPTHRPNEEQVERHSELVAYSLIEGYLYARGGDIPTMRQLATMSAIQVKIRNALQERLKRKSP